VQGHVTGHNQKKDTRTLDFDLTLASDGLSLEFFVFLTYTCISKNPFFSKWDSIEDAIG